MTTNYLTTIYKSHCIISSTKALLRLSNESNLSNFLIIAKTNSLEFFLIKNTGELETKFEYQIFGNILYVATIPCSIKGEPDQIFILTSDFQFSIASVNENQVNISCYGEVSFKENDEAEKKLFVQDMVYCLNSTVKGYIGLLIYKYYLMVIPWKINENGVLSINKISKIKLTSIDSEITEMLAFGSNSNVLSSKNEYFLGFLLQGKETNQFFNYSLFKIYKIEDIDCEIKEPSTDEAWTLKFQETIHKIIYLNGKITKGLIAFGLYGIYFYPYETKTKFEKKTVSLNAGEHVLVPNNENLLILTDQRTGCVFLLWIDLGDNRSPIDIKYLGKSSVCSTIQYLEKKTIFIGSVEDNGYVLRVSDITQKIHNEISYLNIVQSFQNLGIISGIDMIAHDKNNKGLILASPCKKDSLNLFQKGIIFNFSFLMNVPGVVKNIFFLKKKSLILCEINEKYFIFQYNNDTGLIFLKNSDSQVCFACENQNKIIIVSLKKILMLDEQLSFLEEKTLSKLVISAKKTSNLLVLVCQEPNNYSISILLLESLEEIAKFNLSKPFSCLYCNDSHILIGYWFENYLDYIPVSSLPETKAIKLELKKEVIDDPTINPKSFNISSLEIWNEKYLLAGLNNGYLIIFQINMQQNIVAGLIQIKCLLMGDRSVKIYNTKNYGVIINCDQTFLLKFYEKPENLNVEKIWIKSDIEIHFLTEIEEETQKMQLENEENFSKLLVVCENCIVAGYLDSLAQNMIMPFGIENKWKENEIIQKGKNNLTHEYVAVGSEYCITAKNNTKSEEITKSQIIVYSLKTQEILDSFNDFDEKEQINNLLYNESKQTIIFTTDTTNFYEDFTNYENDEDCYGRIYLFYLQSEKLSYSYSKKCLRMISKVEMKNPIECIKQMKENLYVFYCGSTLYIYELIMRNALAKFYFHEIYKKDLKLSGFEIDVSDNSLIVCDPYKNVNLFHYNEQENKLIFLAKLYIGGYSTFSSFYSKEKIICFDHNGNLIISHRKSKAETDLEKITLQILSAMNFGEKLISSLKINEIFCNDYKEILNKQDSKKENFSISGIIWTSERGSIGILAELPKELYNLLMDLQESLLMEIKGKSYFGFEYEKWRQVKDFLGNIRNNHFIDGEILKQFRNLPLQTIEKVLNRMSLINKPKFSDLLFLLEDLEKKLFS